MRRGKILQEVLRSGDIIAHYYLRRKEIQQKILWRRADTCIKLPIRGWLTNNLNTLIILEGRLKSWLA